VSDIKIHVDSGGYAIRGHRLHIPVFTHPQVGGSGCCCVWTYCSVSTNKPTRSPLTPRTHLCRSLLTCARTATSPTLLTSQPPGRHSACWTYRSASRSQRWRALPLSSTTGAWVSAVCACVGPQCTRQRLAACCAAFG
jgi:hypothetical protein